jgi:predicted peptidase
MLIGLMLWSVAWRAGGGNVPEEIAGFQLNTYYSSADQRQREYALYVPPEFEKQPGTFPLILCLSNQGESGKRRVDGLAQLIRTRVKKGVPFPFVTLFPIGIRDEWAQGSLATAMEMLEDVSKKQRIDSRRLYLVGDWRGDCGIWMFAEAFPDKWAGIVAVGLRCYPDVNGLKHIPCWVFEGGKEGVNRLPGLRETIESLRKSGSDVRYTEFPKANFEIWDRVHGERELFTWLSSKSRP